MRGNVQALFGGEGLVFLGNQDPASYPTLLDFAHFWKILPTAPLSLIDLGLVKKGPRRLSLGSLTH
ncbi:hypothetical protein KSC_004820 [Ktedonobacter sp. SOSP1-52]|nr:hypothetical protein KSC_004820 [Ktedonobacter sp. SOSP1-52]